jgi:Holliday junction resolvase RusA-like endonuclease
VTGIVIPGVPVPKGSKAARVVKRADGGLRAQTYDDNSKSLKAWHSTALKAVRAQTYGAGIWITLSDHRPVALRVRFVFPLRVEDQAAIRRRDRLELVMTDTHGRHTHVDTGPCAPGCFHLPWHTVKPDKDKCLRALFDVLTQAGFWNDDGQCCRVEVLAHRGADPRTEVDWRLLDS